VRLRGLLAAASIVLVRPPRCSSLASAVASVAAWELLCGVTLAICISLVDAVALINYY